MQIPVLNGIYTNEESDFRTQYPRNLMPVPIESGISKGYLRPAEGIDLRNGTVPGADRGAFNWNGVHYRVMGNSLVRLDSNGTPTVIGTIAGSGQVTMDYSFDYLSISGGGNLYLYNGAILQRVTNPNLGTSLDHIWVDGYFMSTDGEFLVVTELNDSFTVLPTKYGSSEVDPDPIKAVLKFRNEPYALNRYTIEVFDNVGGNGFPFVRIDGAQVERGTVGTHTCCVFLGGIAFVGGGRKEGIAVWIATGGASVKISTREIDQVLSEYTEAQLSACRAESRVDKGHQLLYIHLPNKTIVYDGAASQIVGEPVWFTLCSSLEGDAIYLARNIVFVYDQWWCGDPLSTRVGTLTYESGEHWGETIGWDFSTLVVYNDGMGALFHELELVSLPGRAAVGVDATIGTQYSFDGESWSNIKYVRAGTTGQRQRRLVWLGQGPMHNWRIQRFIGTSKARLSVARLEARIEALFS